jgi:hypothetical protein
MTAPNFNVPMFNLPHPLSYMQGNSFGNQFNPLNPAMVYGGWYPPFSFGAPQPALFPTVFRDYLRQQQTANRFTPYDPSARPIRPVPTTSTNIKSIESLLSTIKQQDNEQRSESE